MPGRATAVRSGNELKLAVVQLAEGLGLQPRPEVKVGRRLWGAERCIDVVLTRTDTGRSLGVECKFQGVAGSAEEKLPATIHDIGAWPIPGVLVFSGDGFSANMKSYLYSTGKAVDLSDLDDWLKLFFGLPADR
jgi:hypothetical protein